MMALIIPSIITLVCAIIYAANRSTGEWSGIANSLIAVPLISVCLLAWALAGWFK